VTDIFSPRKRSKIMSRIRSSGTTAEQALFWTVRAAIGNRRAIQMNVSQLPGCPDLVIPSLNLVIFANGCFYHGCPMHGHIPKSNKAYWLPKLRGNMRRDVTHRRKLRRLGYRVWTVWEHDLRGTRRESTRRRLHRRFCALMLARTQGN